MWRTKCRIQSRHPKDIPQWLDCTDATDATG